jgi:YVTN family beta-propeller protein
MRSAIFVGLLILALIFSTVSSGIIKMEKADSVIGNPIVVSKGPYRDLFDPDNGLIYVASGNHFFVGGDQGNVTVVDPSKNRAIKNITEPFHHTPRVLAYDSANGKLFMVDVYSNTVTVINTTKNKIIDRISVNPITDGVVYDPANGDIYAINAGGPVSVIDGSTDKVIKNIPVGSNSMDGVFDSKNGNVYVFNLGSGSVSVIDGATNTVLTTIQGLPSPVAGAFDSANGKIYVTNYGTNTVSVIDGSTNTLVNTITVAQEGPANALFDTDNNKIYVANAGHVGGTGPAGNTLSIIDGSSDSVVDNVVIPGPSPVGLAYDPNKKDIYVTNFGSNENPGNTLTVLSTTCNAPDTIIISAIDGNGVPISNGGSTLSTTIQIAFKGIRNNIVGFQCSLDGSIFSSCSSPFTASKLKAGVEHNFKVRAVNSLGNRDATPAVFSWFVLTPAQAISDLIQLVKSMHLSEPTNSVLIPLLEAASEFLSHSSPNNAEACDELVSFTAQVQNAVQLNKITPAQAFQLLTSAQAIEKTLGC